jgi:ketosteroid isomerase-like protein
MKKNHIPVILIAFLAMVSCQNKVDVDKEVEAILSVVQAEGNAHATHDLEGLQNSYIHDSQTVRVHTRKSNYSVLEGWEEVNALFEKWMEMDMSKYSNIKHSKENVVIKVLENSAWLICDNIWNLEVDGNPMEDSEIQITFLEKVDDEWKISFNAIVTKPGPKRE